MLKWETFLSFRRLSVTDTEGRRRGRRGQERIRRRRRGGGGGRRRRRSKLRLKFVNLCWIGFNWLRM